MVPPARHHPHCQIRPVHTRDLTRLSQPQIAEQLKSSDIIFIPVGAVETNGIEPSGRDYTYPLAYAMTMAEEPKAFSHLASFGPTPEPPASPQLRSMSPRNPVHNSSSN